MTYLTTENKQQLCYRRGHDGVGDGSPACYPPGFSKFTATGVRVHMQALLQGMFLEPTYIEQ